MPAPFPLTLPLPGEDALGPWRTRYLRRTARRLVEGPFQLPAGLDRAWAGLRAALAPILAARPADVYAALSLPQVGAPLHAGDLAAAVPPLLVTLAHRRALGPEGIWWPAPVRRILAPTLGVCVEFSSDRVGMVFRDGEVETAPGEVWGLAGPPARAEARRAFSPLLGGGWLATVDNNPLALVEAHPDKDGNTLSLGTADASAWVAALDEARALTRSVLPALAAEHRALLGTVIPVGGPMERSLSASYREAPGLVYVSLHTRPLVLATALLHEVQHNKLNLVSHADPLLEDGGRSLHASPVRPDLRPLWGVLLAVHAFLPVAELYARLRAMDHPLAQEGSFAAEHAAVLAGNREGMDTLRAHARPTELGGALLAGMDRLERAQRAGSPVDEPAAAEGSVVRT